MKQIEFIQGKIDSLIKEIAEYRIKENPEVWEEVSLERMEVELDNYTSVLSTLKVWEQVKNGELEAA